MQRKGQAKLDEFAFILLAGVVLILILMFGWTTPTEAVAIVSPDSVSLSIGPGTSRGIVLNITGNPLTNVTLSSSGRISGWVKYSENNFNVYGSELVTVTFTVPSFTSMGTYSGKIVVNSLAGTKEIPIEIVVTNVTQQLSSKTVILGDFSIIGPTKTLFYKEDLQIERGYFSEKFVSFSSTLEPEEFSNLIGVDLRLNIEETNGLGSLIVEVNGVEVFNKNVEVGQVTIPIDPSIIKESNSVKIRSGLPGWMLWASSVYKIKSIKFVANLQGIYGKEFLFSLDPNEASNFYSMQVQFIVTKYSEALPELFIEVNGQPVYAQVPPKDMFNGILTSNLYGDTIIMLQGNNNIRFSFKQSGIYEVSNGLLKISYKG